MLSAPPTPGAGDEDAPFFNVNADHAAAPLATALEADAVLFLTDVDRGQAEEIMTRLLSGFSEHFASTEPPPVALGYYEVTPGSAEPSLKEVLPALFAATSLIH